VAKVTLSGKDASKGNAITNKKLRSPREYRDHLTGKPIVITAFTLLIGMFLGALFMSLLVISRSDD